MDFSNILESQQIKLDIMLISFKRKFSFLPLYSFFLAVFRVFPPFFFVGLLYVYLYHALHPIKTETNTVDENVLASDRVCTSKVLQLASDPWNTLTNFLRSPLSVFNQLPIEIRLFLRLALSLPSVSLYKTERFIRYQCSLTLSA